MNIHTPFSHCGGRRRQRGVATVLVVTLVGISVMLATAFVVLSVGDKKEASVTQYAQANVQTLNWAGVSAFNQYLQGLVNNLADEEILADKIRQNSEIILSDSPQKIVATIRNPDDDVNCPDLDECRVAAVITAYSDYSQASSSIQTIFKLSKIETPPCNPDEEPCDEEVPEPPQINTGSFEASGVTKITAAKPGSTLDLNANGNVKLLLGFKTENIAVLNVNAKGDVRINCANSNCGGAQINVNATGKVTLLTGNNFGDINAHKNVSLQAGAHAGNIRSLQDVTLTGWSSARNIESLGEVSLYQSVVSGYVKARQKITLSDSTVNGDVMTDYHVALNTNARIKGSVYARGINNPNYLVSVSTSRIDGDIYANGDIWLGIVGRVGNVYITGRVRNSRIIIKGENKSNQGTPVVEIDTPGLDLNATNIYTEKEKTVYVDVTKYKGDANYIFTMVGKFDRVYLNKLTHPSTGHTYLYRDGKQYERDAQGTETLVGHYGFMLGKFAIDKDVYSGAICQELNSDGHCTGDIIGYLPRIGVGRTLGIDDDYGFGNVMQRWRLRSLKNHSSIESAMLAPGIMYFEGDLAFAGAANWSADSLSNAFINSFLAEGEIWAIAFSPRIYSPFNVVRAGEGKEYLVCDRPLTNVDGNLVPDATSLIPGTLSNKYLRPSNLCAANKEGVQTLKPGMSLGPNGDKLKVTIDGVEVDKLELGMVALMANKRIHIGACAQIYGDVLSRRAVTVSAGCGITKNKNKIAGNIFVASASESTSYLLSGSKLDVGLDLGSGGGEDDDDDDDPTRYSFGVEWTKSL